MKTANSTTIFAALGLIWVIGITIGYFVTHKPIDTGIVFRLGEITISVLGGFLIILAGAGLGSRLIDLAELNTATNAFLQLALGMGILALVMLGMGSALGVFGWVNWLLLFIITILFRKEIQRWWSSWGTLKAYWMRMGWFEKLAGFGLVLAALFTFSVATSPPVKFDALVYHLVFPKMYSDAGRISFQENFFWGMPQLGEMLYTWAISLAGLKCAAVLGWTLNWFAVLGLFSFAAESLGDRPAWVTVVAVLSGYSFIASMPSAYVDWMAFFYGLAALITVQKWMTNPSGLYLILAGCFTGFAMGSKYSAGVLLIAICTIILFKNRSRAIPALLQYIGFTIISFSPWLLKNLLATGNPVYPFIAPAGVVDQIRLELYRIPPERNWQDIILLPFRATFAGVEGGPGYSASIGPLLLALSPLALLKKNGQFRLSDQAYWIFTIIGLFVWIVAAQMSGFLVQTRLYYGIFPGIALTAGLGFKQVSTLRVGSVRIGRVIASLIVLILLLTLAQIGVQTIQSGALNYLTGGFNQQDYLERNLGWFAKAMQAVNDLPQGSKTLMLWETRSLYCLPNCVPDEVIDRWKHDLSLYRQPGAVLENWRSKGYSHVLYYRFGAEYVRGSDQRYAPDDWKALDGLLSSLPPPVDLGGAYLLYRLEP